jgi:non-heme chloroperoxidase
MMFFLNQGYRVIAHDRRGHGRSAQTFTGNDMDTYASDVSELIDFLDLKNVIHVGHSTGGGEAIRYAAKYGRGRVAKVVLISAVTPYMIADENNPEGVPLSVFDDIRYNTLHNRQQFYQDLTFPFYGYNRENAVIKKGIQDNWWRQGMMGGIKAQGVFRDRLYRRPEKCRSSRTGPSWRRRPDSVLRYHGSKSR